MSDSANPPEARGPQDLGVQAGQLAPCPDSPNCVSTQAPKDDFEHYIAPVPFEDTPSQAMNRVVQAVTRQPRTRLIKRDSTYLHAEFRSRILRFVDDVEFYIEVENTSSTSAPPPAGATATSARNRERMEELADILRP